MPFARLVDLTAHENRSRSLAERAGLVVTFTTCGGAFVPTRILSDIGVWHARRRPSAEVGHCLHAMSDAVISGDVDVLVFDEIMENIATFCGAGCGVTT